MRVALDFSLTAFKSNGYFWAKYVNRKNSLTQRCVGFFVASCSHCRSVRINECLCMCSFFLCSTSTHCAFKSTQSYDVVYSLVTLTVGWKKRFWMHVILVAIEDSRISLWMAFCPLFVRFSFYYSETAHQYERTNTQSHTYSNPQSRARTLPDLCGWRRLIIPLKLFSIQCFNNFEWNALGCNKGL